MSYGKVAPEEAREIFIRGALVAQESNLQTAFFAHNKKLIKEITELEHKSRKQDVLVDDEALFAFYNERLPELVWKDAKGGVWGSEEGGQTQSDKTADQNGQANQRNAGRVAQATHADSKDASNREREPSSHTRQKCFRRPQTQKAASISKSPSETFTPCRYPHL